MIQFIFLLFMSTDPGSDSPRTSHQQAQTTSVTSEPQHTHHPSSAPPVHPTEDEEIPGPSTQRLQITSGIPAQTSRPTQPQPTHTPSTTLTLPPVHPGDWPSVLINADWMEIISRGPFQINPDFMFLK